MGSVRPTGQELSRQRRDGRALRRVPRQHGRGRRVFGGGHRSPVGRCHVGQRRGDPGGQAKGGENDLLELQNCFRKSKDFIGAAKQQDLTRWGALTAYQLIQTNLEKYESLVRMFKDEKSLADCVSVIEGA